MGWLVEVPFVVTAVAILATTFVASFSAIVLLLLLVLRRRPEGQRS